MTILVTGGQGFLGSKVVDALRSEGQEVLAPTRSDLTLTDVPAVESYLRENGVDTVVHIAACLDRREIPEAQADQWHDTFEAGRGLVTAAASAEVGLFIGTGSMEELGTKEGLVGPDEEPEPPSTYALCKSLLLDICRFASRRSGMQVEWVRPTAIYGPGQTGPMLVPAAFALAVGAGDADFTNGEQARDFVFVDDVVDWYLKATQISRDEDGHGVTVHHLGFGEPTPVKEVLQTIAKLSSADFRLGTIPRRAGEPDLSGVPHYSDERAPLSDWAPEVGLVEGLERTWEWWKAQPSSTQ